MRLRDQLRHDVTEKVMAALPEAQKVVGGLAFYSDVVDSETGKPFPVVIKITIADPLKYDLDAERPKAKKAAAIKEKDPVILERARLNAEAAYNCIKQYAPPGRGLTATEVRDHAEGLQSLTPMQVGKILHQLCVQGKLKFHIDYFNKKYYECR